MTIGAMLKKVVLALRISDTSGGGSQFDGKFKKYRAKPTGGTVHYKFDAMITVGGLEAFKEHSVSVKIAGDSADADTIDKMAVPAQAQKDGTISFVPHFDFSMGQFEYLELTVYVDEHETGTHRIPVIS